MTKSLKSSVFRRQLFAITSTAAFAAFARNSENDMTIDIEERIRRYADMIDEAIDTDQATRPHRAAVATDRDRRLTGPLLAAAAATVTVVGLGVIVASRDTTPPAASEPVETPSTLPAVAAPIDPTGQGVLIDLTAEIDNDTYEPAWDSTRVEPGAVGWFDAPSGLPDDLATQGALTTEMSPAALAAFFTCAEWTVDDEGPLCRGLGGGNGIEHIDYGESGGLYVGIGVQIGGTDVRSQLWNQAYGALWGYETIDTVPEPTEISFGDVTGLSYRVDDQAYLAWEHEPGIVVWLHSQGLSDEQLAEIAAGVEPVELPDRLPLLLEVAAVYSEPVPPMPGDRVEDLSLLVSSNGPPVLKYATDRRSTLRCVRVLRAMPIDRGSSDDPFNRVGRQRSRSVRRNGTDRQWPHASNYCR